MTAGDERVEAHVADVPRVLPPRRCAGCGRSPGLGLAAERALPLVAAGSHRYLDPAARWLHR